MIHKDFFSHLCVLTLCWSPFFNLKHYFQSLLTSHHCHTQPHTVSGPSPIFVVCGLSGWGEVRGVGGSGGWGGSVRRPLHVFSIPPRSPRLSSFGLLLPFHLRSPSSFHPSFSSCPPNCPLAWLFVYLQARLSLWPVCRLQLFLCSWPKTPWEATSDIILHNCQESLFNMESVVCCHDGT